MKENSGEDIAGDEIQFVEVQFDVQEKYHCEDQVNRKKLLSRNLRFVENIFEQSEQTTENIINKYLYLWKHR